LLCGHQHALQVRPHGTLGLVGGVAAGHHSGDLRARHGLGDVRPVAVLMLLGGVREHGGHELAGVHDSAPSWSGLMSMMPARSITMPSMAVHPPGMLCWS